MSTFEDAISRMTTTLVPLIIMGKEINYKSILVMMVSMFIPQIITFINELIKNNRKRKKYSIVLKDINERSSPYNAVAYVISTQNNELSRLETKKFISEYYYAKYDMSPFYNITKNTKCKFTFNDITINIETQVESMSTKNESTEKLSLCLTCDHSIEILKEYIRDCCNKMHDHIKTKKSKKYHIYKWVDEAWTSSKISVVKNPDYVIINDNVMESVIEHIETFNNSKEIYDELCLAYKKGFILSGQPGCGKTSVVYSVAYKYQKNIYYIDNSVLFNTKNIEKAFSTIKDNSIILCDDFDAYIKKSYFDEEDFAKIIANASNSDNDNDNDDNSNTSNTSDTSDTSNTNSDNNKTIVKKKKDKDKNKNKKTRSDIIGKLLEMFDAYNYIHGCIIFMTTNYIEDIDPAIIRPGRFDIRYDVTIPNIETIRKIVCKYLKIDDEIIDGLGALDPEYHENIDLSSAKIINTCIIPNINDYDKAIFEIQELLSCKNIQE